MPIRTHIKTRTGCKTCKRRRVKCDEELPICKNCTRRSIECVWIDTSQSHSVAPGTSTRATSSTSPENSPSTISKWTGAGSFDLLTLELIHHYTTATSHTLSPDPAKACVWDTSVSKLAFDPKNHFLLYAILAMSALHAYHDDPTASRYSVAASTYHCQAKMGLHMAETDGGKNDARAVLMALCLLAMYEFATSSMVSLSAGDWNVIARKVAKLWPQRVLRPMLFMVSTSSEEPFSSSLLTLVSTAHPSPPDLEELQDISVYAAYKESIRILEISWKASLQNWDAALWWWVMAPNTFFRLLAEGKPRALIILAHHCVLMKRVAEDGPWWAKRQWGVEAARILSALDTRWMPWLGWLWSQLDEDQAFDVVDRNFMNWLSEVSSASLLNTS
ncbi:uncharacterized protein EV420DRAFT_1766345 [Desarmillaria tabescens]|uniref:Zn(2)-C6 fungal-type domain-containing protein n=1 Tax=Armillaria tabescens TaxID=1929756 RepID=A0AA39MYF0_ARMTA|nr:uncharacterized protein EV420DRAFT_1766345 [Desarmillaria tabescens]KAK0451292.1 hypothetical protein EV420DRAFT_1766345 [Desarmillaria tabescens]